MPPRLLQQAPPVDVCAMSEQGCSCLGSCFTDAVAFGAPPCMRQCAEDYKVLAALVLVLPFACRVLDFYWSMLKGDGESSSRKKRKGKKGKGKNKYDRLEKGRRNSRTEEEAEEKTNAFTMKKLVAAEELSFDDVADEYEWDSTQAYLCAAARMLFCHIAQPVLYIVLFSFAAVPHDDELLPSEQSLGGLSLACGWCVALREAAYLVVALVCAFKNPAFLLIDVPATVNDDGEKGGDSLCSGKTFLMAYVSSPLTFVLKALCGPSGLDLEDEEQFLLAGSFALDLCAVAALGGAVGDGTARLWLTAFYAVTAGGGGGASVVFLQRKGSKIGPICLLLVAVAVGGGFAIGSGKVELASIQAAVICLAELALGFVAFEKSGGGSAGGRGGDSGDSDDSDQDSDKSGSDGSGTDGSGTDDGGDRKFKAFDPVEVYSKSAAVWCTGEVQTVDTMLKTVKVEYKNDKGAMMQKVLMMDSPDLKLLKKSSSGSTSRSRSPQARPRSNSKGALRREMSVKEETGDFAYEVLAEFKKGKMGFVFEEGDNGEVYVNKVSKKTPAAEVPHACPGMILRRYEVKPNARWKLKKLKGTEDYEEVLDILKDSRPIKLYFEHPWQFVPGKRGKAGNYYNWFDDVDQDERPPELEDVYETMREWMDAEDLSSDTTDPYASPGKGELTRTNTSIKYRCQVRDTKETGTFTRTTRYTIKCFWNGFEGESEHRYSGAQTAHNLPACPVD